MADIRPFLQAAADALGPALKSFFLTAMAMSFLAIVVAPSSYFVAANSSIVRGSVASVASLALCTVLGFTLSWKRALGSGILQIARKRRVGGVLVEAVFARLLGVDEQGAIGERGMRMVQMVERLPLNEAAKRLRFAVIHQIQAAPRGGGLRGFLRRKIEARLLRVIEQLTLARFRNEDHEKGGVDLLKVRDDLSARADDLIADKIEGMMMTATLVLAGASIVVSIGAAYGIRQIPVETWGLW